MRITVVGAGAMGGSYGGLLARAGHEVDLIDAWQAHVDAINRDGLRVDGVRGRPSDPAQGGDRPGPASCRRARRRGRDRVRRRQQHRRRGRDGGPRAGAGRLCGHLPERHRQSRAAAGGARPRAGAGRLQHVQRGEPGAGPRHADPYGPDLGRRDRRQREPARRGAGRGARRRRLRGRARAQRRWA